MWCIVYKASSEASLLRRPRSWIFIYALLGGLGGVAVFPASGFPTVLNQLFKSTTAGVNCCVETLNRFPAIHFSVVILTHANYLAN